MIFLLIRSKLCGAFDLYSFYTFKKFIYIIIFLNFSTIHHLYIHLKKILFTSKLYIKLVTLTNQLPLILSIKISILFFSKIIGYSDI